MVVDFIGNRRCVHLLDLLYAQINVVGIILLLLLLNNMNKNSYKDKPLDQQLFNNLLIMNILIFIFDSGMWLVDGDHFVGAKVINYIVTLLYYISNPLICFLWLMYTDFKIHESRIGLKKRVGFYMIPCIVSSILSIVSVYTGWLFQIDEKNNYMRGPHFWIMALFALFYLVFSCILSIKNIIKNGWKESKSINTHLLLFPIGIITASIIQIMIFGLSIIWVCAMLAFASIYINIQNGEISTDYLTGLYNRRRLDEHLQRRLRMRRKEQKLFVIMMDMDKFKDINDKYGHAVGDEALVKMAELLREICKESDDFIARMGGDEFVIVGERTQVEEIEKIMDTISSKAMVYNELHKANYALLPSMGCSIFNIGETIDSFLVRADQEMYRNKQERKQQNTFE